jgi:hypothetical protein
VRVTEQAVRVSYFSRASLIVRLISVPRLQGRSYLDQTIRDRDTLLPFGARGLYSLVTIRRHHDWLFLAGVAIPTTGTAVLQ